MRASTRWSRPLVIGGLVAMLVGALDPLEGSLVILPGAAAAALGARLGGGRHRTLLLWSFVLVAVGVATLWGMSVVGGLGGSTGRSMWWALTLLPYPVGWVLALVGAVLTLLAGRRDASRSG
jgi:hypothetical protein